MHRIPAELLELSPREVWIPVRFLALSRWAEFTIFLLNLLLADNRGAVSSSWQVACVPSSGKSSFSEGSSLAGMQEAGVQLCSPTETEVCLLLLAHILWGIFSGTNQFSKSPKLGVQLNSAGHQLPRVPAEPTG